jgi:hypothetical protein
VPNASGGTSKVQTIIPEAYMVTIQLTCLVSETQNFLYHMLFEKQNKVNVMSQQIGTGNVLLDTLTNSFREGLSL